MDEELTREQIKCIRDLSNRGGTPDHSEIIALCDMALRSLQRDAADYFRAGRILGESSGDTVRVPVDLLRNLEEGYRSRCEYCKGDKKVCEELDLRYGVPCFGREAWCLLARRPEGSP